MAELTAVTVDPIDSWRPVVVVFFLSPSSRFSSARLTGAGDRSLLLSRSRFLSLLCLWRCEDFFDDDDFFLLLSLPLSW